MADELPWEAVSQELVRALRGERSQTALYRRLRYQSNVVYLWENGRRYPSPASFFWLLHRTGGDVDGVLTILIGERRPTEPVWTVPGAAELLDLLRGGRTSAELAKALGASRHTVGRWMRGDAETRLPIFLAMVELCTGSALPFIGSVIDPEQLPSIRETWRMHLAARELLASQPWAPAILLALELRGYHELNEHVPGWLAEHVGLTLDEEVRCLELMVTAGQVSFDGTRYHQVREPAISISMTEHRERIRAFWIDVAARRGPVSPESLVSWRLFTCSEEQLGRIKDLQRRYYRDMRAIVLEDEAADHVVLTSSAVVPLDVSPVDPPTS